MPFMERLTWDGMAIHGGNNPGKPSSHGCIHVPLDFAEKLYATTQKGDTVLISDLKEAPGDTVTPGLMSQQTPEPARTGRARSIRPGVARLPPTFLPTPPRSRRPPRLLRLLPTPRLRRTIEVERSRCPRKSEDSTAAQLSAHPVASRDGTPDQPVH